MIRILWSVCAVLSMLLAWLAIDEHPALAVCSVFFCGIATCGAWLDEEER